MVNFIKKFKGLDKYTQLALIILAIGILVRIIIAFFAYPSGDSTRHLSSARFIARNFAIPMLMPIGIHVFWPPPLFHIVAAVFYNIFSIFGGGFALKSMNFVNPIFGSLTLVIFYKFVKDIFNKKIVLYSLIFLSFIPIHIYYSTISHIDVTVTFFALFTLYLLYKKRFYWSAIFCGLGVLIKYNMFFMFPVLAFILWDQNKKFFFFLKRTVLYFVIAFVVGLPWYIRNILYLGAPFYPFLNGFFRFIGFKPLEYSMDAALHTGGLYNLGLMRWPTHLFTAYLDMFGIPLGLKQNFAFFPFKPYSLILWGIVTMFFFLPMIIGFFSKKPKTIRWILYFWILSYVLMIIVFLIDWADMSFRLFLPMVPAFAIIWGIGLDKLFKIKFKCDKLLKILVVLMLIGCVFVFVTGEFVKTTIATKQHEKYFNDYNWVKENTPENTVFYPFAHGLGYSFDRYISEDVEVIDYYFKYDLTYKEENIRMLDKLLEKEMELVYKSEYTDVEVYKIIK